MNNCYGVLLEVVSIQDYIFQSNTLKTNLGASHLIQNKVFNDYLKTAVSEVFGKSDDLAWEVWLKNPSVIRISNDPFEIGYIGGGNALLLFQEEEKAKQVIRAWSRLLLVQAPGVVAAVAVDSFNPAKFQESCRILFKQLKNNKAAYIPQTTIPRHGITTECRQSGLSAELLIDWEKDKKEFVSSVTGAKINAATSARNHFQVMFKTELQNDYCFPNEFEKLGSISGEDSHIAVVHIDGNRMAQRFKNANSLQAYRELSKSVHEATMSAFSELVAHTVNNYQTIMEDLGFDNQNKDKRYWYPMDDEYKLKCLPLTPMVLGGDDVTFVCDGRLGIYFAKRFIEAFEKKTVSDEKKLTASAGIAIIKTKYPFYRGYQLAEELCSSAKKVNGKEDDPSKLVSALDFHVSMSGIYGMLDQIREKHFHAPEGYLLYRPYKLVTGDTKDEKSLDQMLELCGKLKKDFPNSKIKELQSVLSQSEDAQKMFITEANYRSRSLPKMPGKNYHKTIFENDRTIYYDMIELTEFYPKHALKKRGEQ